MEKIPNNAPIYISGPITGHDREEYLRRFAAAEDALRELGYENIVNPTRLPMCRWRWLYRLLGYRLTLFIDLWLLTGCSVIYKMPGWKTSRGAQIESCVAFHFHVWTLNKKDREVVDKAVEDLA